MNSDQHLKDELARMHQVSLNLCEEIRRIDNLEPERNSDYVPVRENLKLALETLLPRLRWANSMIKALNKQLKETVECAQCKGYGTITDCDHCNSYGRLVDPKVLDPDA